MLGSPLPRSAMSSIIRSAYNDITSTIASKGDSILPKSEDPFVYNKGYGAYIAVHSAKGQHLTWSLLEGAVVGLHNGLYLRERYRASEFWVWDGPVRLVGVGEMGSAVVGTNGTVRWTGTAIEGKANGNGDGSGILVGNGELETSKT